MVSKTKIETASRVVITDRPGNRSASSVTSAELSSIDGGTADLVINVNAGGQAV